MTSYSPGDVVLIPFPFTDFSSFKQRPAVIISSSHFNAMSSDIIVAAITSQIPDPIPQFDYLLSDKDQSACGLPKTSLIKLGKIVTINQRLIRKKIGAIPHKSMENILQELSKVIPHPSQKEPKTNP